jgi:hypothetical protein
VALTECHLHWSDFSLTMRFQLWRCDFNSDIAISALTMRFRLKWLCGRVARRHTFIPIIPFWVYFGGSWNLKYWDALCPLGIFYCNLVYFAFIWYIFSRFCCTKKNLATLVCCGSGNTDYVTNWGNITSPKPMSTTFYWGFRYHFHRNSFGLWKIIWVALAFLPQNRTTQQYMLSHERQKCVNFQHLTGFEPYNFSS